MKSLSLRLVAALLFVLPHAHADEPTPKPGAMQATKTAMAEFQDALEAGPHLGRNLERMLDFQHTPATAALLEQSFGTPRPWQLEKLGGKPGAQQSFRLTVPQLRYAIDPDTVLSWTDFATSMTVDKTGRRVAFRGVWPELRHDAKELKVALHDLRIVGDQRLGKGKLWFGTMQADIDRVAFTANPPAATALFTMRGIGFTSRAVERPTTMELAQRFHVATITAGDEEIRDLTVAYRFDKLDKQAIIGLMQQERQRTTGGQEDVAGMVEMFKGLARSASRWKSTLVLERVSAEYAGHRFNLNGRIAIKGVKESDFDDPAKLMERIDARLDVAVPVDLIKAGALVAAKRQLATSGNPGGDAAALAQTMTDVVMGKLLGEGYAKLDKGVLRATVTVRNGQLRINGMQVELPTPPADAPAAQPDVAMPARQITGSCPLPDYPAEVVDKDAPLALTLRVLVDETGTPGQITVTTPSAWPDYDAQVVAAHGACRYIPALLGDAPVAQPLTVTIAREPGTVRP